MRPSLWILAAVFFAGVGFVLYEAGQYDGAPRDDVGARAEHELRFERRSSTSRSRAEPSTEPSRPSSGGGSYQHHDWGTESELSRRVALGLPLDGFWNQPPDFERDPQLAAMWRSFHSHRESESDEPALPFEPTAHRAELLEAEGDVAASPSSCDVRVLPVDAMAFNCVVRVTCDGAILYPNQRQDAGYVPCEIEDGRPVRAVDDGQSDRDGDPLVDMDLGRGTITVEDSGPDGTRRDRATLRIAS